MPLWAFAVIIPVALLACPLSMWVMSKVMKRKGSCAMCAVGAHSSHENTAVDLEGRKAAVEREIAQVKTEIEQRGISQRATAKIE